VLLKELWEAVKLILAFEAETEPLEPYGIVTE
jgi:hypothetical protein